MLDWQRHEDELTNTRIARDVVRAGHRVRRWRAALAALAVLVLAGGITLGWPAPSSTVVSGSGSTVRTPVRAFGPTDRIQLYLLALAGPRIGGVETLVPERLCVGAAEHPVLPCRGALIPAPVQDAIRHTTPSVRFVSAVAWPQRPGEPVVFGFGALVVHGDRASLETQTLCGSLCGTGGRWEFAREGTRWTVVRRAGTWIS